MGERLNHVTSLISELINSRVKVDLRGVLIDYFGTVSNDLSLYLKQICNIIQSVLVRDGRLSVIQAS
jgi:predicted membrane chloride channel (bestrophin family)